MAVLFTILNALIFRVDQVPDVSEMYTVERTQAVNGGPSLLTRPMLDAMRADTQRLHRRLRRRARSTFASTAG